MPIISASRRTDIPSCHSKWFFDCLKDQFCTFKLSKTSLQQTISLKLINVDCFIFWSKNYIPFIPYLDKLDKFGAPFYFHFTINNYPKPYEPSLPDIEKIVDAFKYLSMRYGKERIIWRYDPIFLTKEIKPEDHVKNYKELFDELHKYTSSCYISVIDKYKKIVSDSIVRQKIDFDAIYDKSGFISDEIEGLAKEILAICNSKQIDLYACCEQNLHSVGLKQGKCIDLDLINKISNNNLFIPPAPTRFGCGCAKVVDIGTFSTCGNGCVYCYAN